MTVKMLARHWCWLVGNVKSSLNQTRQQSWVCLWYVCDHFEHFYANLETPMSLVCSKTDILIGWFDLCDQVVTFSQFGTLADDFCRNTGANKIMSFLRIEYCCCLSQYNESHETQGVYILSCIASTMLNCFNTISIDEIVGCVGVICPCCPSEQLLIHFINFDQVFLWFTYMQIIII